MANPDAIPTATATSVPDATPDLAPLSVCLEEVEQTMYEQACWFKETPWLRCQKCELL